MRIGGKPGTGGLVPFFGNEDLSTSRLSPVFLFGGRVFVSSTGNAERTIGMKSEIKIGQQFEFAIRADKELRHLTGSTISFTFRKSCTCSSLSG
jgi:hypothetical protein